MTPPPPTLHSSTIRSLPLLGRGKVRDNYAVGDDRILMIATDRVSAFDVVMDQPIPGKGVLLTQMSRFWFDLLGPKGRNLCAHHLLDDDPASVVDPDEAWQVEGRAMLVRKLRPIPVEAVVRGFLAGSGAREYLTRRSVCGIPLPEGLAHASRLPEPLYTPTTKAALGAHDENITYERTVEMLGEERALQIRNLSIALYRAASDIALGAGILLADTKFEFGLDADDHLVLMDEVLTPDSSRYWPVKGYVPGETPPSFDKQYLRDWLESAQVDGKPWNKTPPPPRLPAEVIANTAAKYREALERLTSIRT
ncbi:phosphoribosylaminoimidazolesuccinocarboxamide synthase [Candidatus Symbiobacter mobilis]|uniref:Phosphoribosylaminoimidazole-succinocarboxamide synthase n=1 Tax=Candidatus Symbiobacter mobilis CR TaxID=946483 RepID=U5NA69_9BURK|nr:phosphoribosylaminoimidazolesuccinocarboxamide synthase [Candidatus Symbiobacter mobilis]AGX88436.1 phosphoribosylaminoimidazole-succinocarboxamide synthase [Candidatus Symbiobacter mobilis CR]